MWKWQGLLGIVATVQLGWGITAFIAYGQSVGATGDATDACVYTGLGLSAVLVLVWPRCGILMAVVQALAGLHALCWLPFALACLRMPLGVFPFAMLLPLPPAIGLLILRMAAATALLSFLAALASWRLARAASVFQVGIRPLTSCAPHSRH